VNLPRSSYDIIISKSVLHHLHQPSSFWDTVRRYSCPGTYILVKDLIRPNDEAAAQQLVNTCAADEPELFKRDFYNSLLASFTVDEVKEQLFVAQLNQLTVSVVSDRHLLIAGVV
jgi:hypothetical protein